jgi:uridine phosphorylase
MPVPLDPAKYQSSPFFNPGDFLDYMRRIGRLGDEAAPEAVILSYQRSLFEHVIGSRPTTPPAGYFANELRYLDDFGGKIAIGGRFGIGAPAAAVMIEELIAFGVKRFVSVGTAGSLRADLPPGSLIVCDSALRDEGSSYHYLPGGAPVYPSEALTKRLAAALTRRGLAFGKGKTWTTDAIYRETAAEVIRYRDEGVMVVEMEAAALFAVARFRGVEIAACFSVSDTLAELQWRPEFHAETTSDGLEDLFAAAIEALS